MATVSTWDGQVASMVRSALLSTTGLVDPTRLTSDTRRDGYVTDGKAYYQIVHAIQGKDSSINSAQSYFAVQTLITIVIRDSAQTENTYISVLLPQLQQTVSIRSTYEALVACFRVIEGPTTSPPSSSDSGILEFTVELAILLDPS